MRCWPGETGSGQPLLLLRGGRARGGRASSPSIALNPRPPREPSRAAVKRGGPPPPWDRTGRGLLSTPLFQEEAASRGGSVDDVQRGPMRGQTTQIPSGRADEPTRHAHPAAPRGLCLRSDKPPVLI